jgi:hypothetical protein
MNRFVTLQTPYGGKVVVNAFNILYFHNSRNDRVEIFFSGIAEPLEVEGDYDSVRDEIWSEMEEANG